MISKVSLKNFKLHASTIIEAAPITVFIGPNNSGKSSLFQALLRLRQAASGAAHNFCHSIERQNTTAQQLYLFAPEQIIDIGEFQDVVRYGQNEIQIGITGTIHPLKPLKYGVLVEVGFDIHVRDNRSVYHTVYLKSSYGKLSWDRVTGSPTPSASSSVQVEGVTLRFRVEDNFRLLDFSGYEQPPNFPSEKLADLVELGRYLGNAPVQFLNSLHPIFPLRGFEEWGYPLPDSPAVNLDRMTLADRIMALASILAYTPELVDKLSDWLEDLLQTRIRIKLLPGKRVTIRSTRLDIKNSDTAFTNEGTGANQLPFILVPIGLTPPNETIFLCEPEAHLHPKAQAHLVSLLLKIVKQESRQFFIETHSEHVLHAFLHAVAKGELERDQLAIYYFENVKGTAQVKRLEITAKGQVKGGLPGFFEHSLAELAEYLDAFSKP